MSKRFTYWTSDGKRHWTPLFDPPITLSLSESAKLRRRRKKYAACTRKELLEAVRPKSARHRAEALAL